MTDVVERHKQYYIAGPMSGIPEYNFPAFFEAEKRLAEMGFLVVNPARLDIEDGTPPEQLTLHKCMKRDLPEVMTCDGVVLLPGWEKSKGALCEAFTALSCKLPVMLYPRLMPVSHGEIGAAIADYYVP